MSDRVTAGVGDIADLYETINTYDGTLVADDVVDVTLTVWRCGTPGPSIDGATASAEPATGPGVEVHAPIGTVLAERGLYLARWRAELTDGQHLSFPSTAYTLIEVT